MKKIIITDLTRFTRTDIVCTAAIDLATGRCLRPMPYLQSATCQKLNIHPGTILEGDLELDDNASSPHTEDATYKTLTFNGVATGDKFKSILDESLSDSVSSGFEVQLQQGQKHIPVRENTNCSIITIKVNPNALSIHEDQYKPGKIKASFTDLSGHSFHYLSITDRGFFDYAKQHQHDGRLEELSDFIKRQDEVYLRIGLSREYQVPDGRNGYWLQVNGIYTFPSFHKEIRTYG